MGKKLSKNWRSAFQPFKKHPLVIFAIAILIGFAVFWAILFKLDFSVSEGSITYGITFSKSQAEKLNLDWREVLIASLDELNIRHFRLSAYWNETEPQDDHYDFQALDWQIDQISQRGGTIILSIGQKLPRWPGCHTPIWAEKLDYGEQQQKILQMIPVVISRYEDNPAIIRWQVENEPLSSLSEQCAPPDENFFKKELALVRRMDQTRPIMATAGGKLENWDGTTGQYADILGVSLNRTTWKPFIGYFDYPIPPIYYKLSAEAAKNTVQKIVLSDLQAEPWLQNEPINLPTKKFYQLMNPKLFNKTTTYAQSAG